MAKIMVVGPLDPDSFADNISDSLNRMGHNVLAAGPARPRPRLVQIRNLVSIAGDRLPRQDAFMQRHLINAERAFRPEIILSTDRTLQPAVVKQLRAGGARIALWFPDAVSNMGRHDMFLAGYDRIFFKNPALVRQLTAVHGIAASYLPEAFNPTWHVSNEPYGIDESIVLVGNVHPTRAILLDRMVRAGLPLKIFGHKPGKWIDFPALESVHTGRDVRRQAKAQVFRRARVVLNNLHPAEFAGVNCRVFEAAGAGGAIVTESREGLAQTFEPGRELSTFSSFEELVERCQLLLSNRAAGESISNAAADRAMREHTYDLRLAELLECL